MVGVVRNEEKSVFRGYALMLFVVVGMINWIIISQYADRIAYVTLNGYKLWVARCLALSLFKPIH